MSKAKKGTIKVSTPAKTSLTAPSRSTKAVNNKVKSSGREISSKKDIRLKAFAYAYAHPESSTLGNATQSLITVNPKVTYSTAKSQGQRLSTNSNLPNEIEALYSSLGMDFEVRQSLRAKAIRHDMLGKTITRRVKDSKTGEVSIEVTRGPTFGNQFKQLNEMDKIAGVYNQAELQKELIRPAVQELARTHLKDIKARIRARRETGEGG